MEKSREERDKGAERAGTKAQTVCIYTPGTHLPLRGLRHLSFLSLHLFPQCFVTSSFLLLIRPGAMRCQGLKQTRRGLETK